MGLRPRPLIVRLLVLQLDVEVAILGAEGEVLVGLVHEIQGNASFVGLPKVRPERHVTFGDRDMIGKINDRLGWTDTATKLSRWILSDLFELLCGRRTSGPQPEANTQKQEDKLAWFHIAWWWVGVRIECPK